MNKTSVFFNVLIGILFVALGFFVIAAPATTLNLIILVAGILLIVRGIIVFIDYFRSKSEGATAFLVVQGVLSVLAGILLLVGNNFVIATVLAYLMIFTFLVLGILRLVESFYLTGAARVAGIILNILVIAISIWAFFSVALALSILIWMIAFEFIIVGIERIVTASVTKKLKK